MAQVRAPLSLPAKSAFFRPSAIGRMVRSTVLVSTSIRPSSKNRVRPAQWPSIYLIASTKLDRLGRSARAVINRVFRASRIGFVSACRRATPLGGIAAPDPRLDRINLAQGGDDVARERGVGGLVDGDELATGMGQTECELDLGM